MKNEELENHKQNLNSSLLISNLSLKNSAVKQSDFLWREDRYPILTPKSILVLGGLAYIYP